MGHETENQAGGIAHSGDSPLRPIGIEGIFLGRRALRSRIAGDHLIVPLDPIEQTVFPHTELALPMTDGEEQPLQPPGPDARGNRIDRQMNPAVLELSRIIGRNRGGPGPGILIL